VDEFVISLSAKGLTPGEAQAHLAEVYSAQVSRQTISTITDKVMEGMAVWQKPAAGPGLSGEAGEGVKHWLHVLAELKNRGVIDALMVVWCGLPETIEHVAPQTPGERGRHRRRGRPASPPRSARCPTLFCTSDYCEQLPARTHLDHPNYRFNFSQVG
jgi:hypothetical protein